MNLLTQTLNHPVGLLFVVIAAGILIGQIWFGKFRLGGSGVLIAGLVFGHYGFSLPREIQTIGVVLFVYSVGLGAGPYFIESIKKSKGHLLIIALLIVLSAGSLALAFKFFFGFSPEMISGIYAGAMTSTPALAAAMEASGSSNPSIGYGLAYPLGVLSVILLVQILPVLFKTDLQEEEKKYQAEFDTVKIERRSFKVTNPNVTAMPLHDTMIYAKDHFRIVRVKRDGKVITAHPDESLCLNDIVLVVGQEDALDQLRILLGEPVEMEIPESEMAKSRWIVISSKRFVGKRIGHLEIGRLYGVIITRVRRGGVEIVPSMNFAFEAGDEVRASGEPEHLQRFAELTGQDKESIFETDIFSFAVGLALGVLVGFIKIPVTGKLSISLGIAGGPLIVGLIFGYFGRFGRLTGYMPKAAKVLVGELGLYLFLAVAGCAAGQHFVSTLMEKGMLLILCGFLMTLFPILVTAIVSRYLFKMNVLMMLGMICGGMTSTPALGVISNNTKSDVPALGYTGIYPMAVLFTTLMAQILVLF